MYCPTNRATTVAPLLILAFCLPIFQPLFASNPVADASPTIPFHLKLDTLPPVVTAAKSGDFTCVNSVVLLSATATPLATSYVWANMAGEILAYDSLYLPPFAGTYVITAFFPDSSSATDYIAVDLDVTPPDVNVEAENLGCSDTVASLWGISLTPNVSFTWTGPNGFLSENPATTTTAPGAYDLLVTCATNGCTSSATAYVQPSPDLPTAAIYPPLHLNCWRDTVLLDATASSFGPNFSMAWSSSAGGHFRSDLDTPTPVVDSAGVYKILITNNLTGCTSSASVAVVQRLPVQVQVFEQQPIACSGEANGILGAAVSGGAGQFKFEWSSVNGTPLGTDSTLANLPAGQYAVAVVDTESCEAIANFLFKQPDTLHLAASATDETGPGAHDGTASASLAGGTQPYHFLWSSGDSTAVLTGLAPGNYTVTATDARGCFAVQALTVKRFPCVLSASFSTLNVRCTGESSGSAAVQMQGGLVPFSYQWSTGGSGQSIVGLAAGTLTVTVTDATGCLLVGTTSVQEPAAALAISLLEKTAASCSENSDGMAEIAASGGTGAATFAWSNGATWPMVAGLAPGNFTVTATDANGCTATSTVEILVEDKTAPNLICPANQIFCENETFAPPLTFSDNCELGGNAPVQTAGPTGPSFPVGISELEFSLTDKSGNTASCAFSVTVLAAPNFSANITHDVDAGGQGSIDLTSNLPDQTCQFQWAGPNGFTAATEDLTGLFAGTYTVIITNQLGCTATQSVDIQNLVPTVEASDPATWRVFPNPTDGFLQVEMGDAKIRFAQILDLQGRVLRTLEGVEKLDIRDLPAGLFALRIFAENGASGSLRFARN